MRRILLVASLLVAVGSPSVPAQSLRPRDPQSPGGSLQQAQPAQPSRRGALGTKDTGPRRLDKPVLSAECQSSLDRSYQELSQVKTGLTQARSSGLKLKAAHQEMVKKEKAYAKAQKVAGRTSGRVGDAATMGAPAGATAAGSLPPATLKQAQAAGVRARQHAQELGVLTQRVDQGLVRANTEVARLEGCRGIPASKLQRLIGTVKSIRSQIKGQVSTLRSMPGGGSGGEAQDCEWCKGIGVEAANASNAQGAQEQSLQDALRDIEETMEELRNKRSEYQQAFVGFDDKANQLFNLLSTVLKNEKEMQSGISRSLL